MGSRTLPTDRMVILRGLSSDLKSVIRGRKKQRKYDQWYGLANRLRSSVRSQDTVSGSMLTLTMIRFT